MVLNETNERQSSFYSGISCREKLALQIPMASENHLWQGVEFMKAFIYMVQEDYIIKKKYYLSKSAEKCHTGTSTSSDW